MNWFISVVVTNKRSMGSLLRRSLLWRRKLLAACLSPPVWLDMIIDDGSRTCASPAFGELLAGRLPYTLHRARWVLPLPLGPSSSFIYSARRGELHVSAPARWRNSVSVWSIDVCRSSLSSSPLVQDVCSKGWHNWGEGVHDQDEGWRI